jgi:cytochrome c oxidase subunit 3
MEAAALPHGPGGHAADHDDHHGPPTANSSSRVEPQLLGMLLFIISEIMVFGAFFTAYFFIRVVAGSEWFPTADFELPKAVAGVNTAILVSSSLTMHWALEGAKHGNRAHLKTGLLLTLLLGSTFLFVQINEYINLTQEGLTPSVLAVGSVFYGLTGLHGAHVFIGLTLLLFATIRAFRGHFTPEEHRGVEVPGIYWHFVDVMWILVYSSVYLL